MAHGTEVATEVERFLAEVMPVLTEAEIALHHGNAAPRRAIWSRNDPVTVFGAARSSRGWDETAVLFRWLEERFSNCVSYEFELVAAGASGDLAYIAGIEHTTASVSGAPPESYKLRSTTVFRRESGAWKAVHRHADPLPGSHSTLARFEDAGEH